MNTKVSSWHRLLGCAAITFGLMLAGCASLKPVQVVEVSGPDSLLTNEEAQFAASITPEATQPVSTVWNFGDGSQADTLVATHSYDVPRTYEVTFTASNRKGDDVSSDTRSLDVVVEAPISAPTIVAIDYDPRNVDTQSNVTISANVREDSREVTGYEWAVAGETVASAPKFTHTFSDPGSYEVSLTVTNSAGSDSRSTAVVVVPYEAEICRELTDLNPAFFDRNSSTLSDDTRAALSENADILTVCPNTCVSISGFVDPDERRADDLSAARASAVETFYVGAGVPINRIEARGEGRVSGVSRKEGLAQFRRADSVPMRCDDSTDAS